jgi:hypothetical protein
VASSVIWEFDYCACRAKLGVNLSLGNSMCLRPRRGRLAAQDAVSGEEERAGITLRLKADSRRAAAVMMHSKDQIHHKECPQHHQPILSVHRITTDVTQEHMTAQADALIVKKLLTHSR